MRERRRAVLARWDPRIRAEQRQARSARERAIADLERFVREHPSDRPHTPNALLRLAELQLARALDRADAPGAEEPDLEPAIATARDLRARFPRYAHRARAGYLLGWALAAAGRADEAAAAWRAEVCPGSSQSAPRYARCPPDAGGELAAEMWLRLGAHHLELDELASARAAFLHVVAHPDDRLFGVALYQLGATHERAGEHARAIARFAELIEHVDAARARTGRRSALREAGVEGIARALACDDWDHDGTPDHEEGGAHPLERLEDPRAWPRERPWASAIYRRVGDELLAQGHPDEARMAWRLVLARGAGCETRPVLRALADVERRLGLDDAAARTEARGAEVGACPAPGH